MNLSQVINLHLHCTYGLWVQRCLHSKLHDGANNISLIACDLQVCFDAIYSSKW